jgi:hopanoid biosynthesis associated protein HpnK
MLRANSLAASAELAIRRQCGALQQIHSVKRLVITADDFGSSPEVNEAVEQAHRHGVLTAASLMVGAPAAVDAVARARTMPKLGVGLHLVLLDGWPVLSPRRLPDLVDARGRFRHGLLGTSLAVVLPRVRRQLADEIAAQFEAFAATDLALDHVNAHKHLHVHPLIAELVLEAMNTFGLCALRAPLEQRPVLARIEPGVRQLHPRIWLESKFSTLLRNRARRSKIMTPDAVFGLAWSGNMGPSRLRGLVTNLPMVGAAGSVMMENRSGIVSTHLKKPRSFSN